MNLILLNARDKSPTRLPRGGLVEQKYAIFKKYNNKTKKNVNLTESERHIYNYL